jgi:sugar fermentation stimulation protein A
MLFPRPLVRGRLVQRYKRFFADVELDGGGPVTAHVANPGAMLGVKSPGQPVWLAPVDDPKRSLKYTLELVEQDGALVGVNTHHPNRLAAEAIAGGVIPELAGYAVLRREVRYDGDSRVDFLLEDPARPPCWVEVKNVHFARAPGRRVEAGERAVALFVVQRMDCEAFSACADLDPAFAAGLDAAAAEGVEVLVYACRMGLDGIAIERPIAWRRSTLTP